MISHIILARARIHVRIDVMKSSPIKYFLSIRKSTDDNKHQVLSLPAQKSELDAFAKREDLYIYDTIEESESAKAPGRKVFNSMLDRIDRGEANGILCWDIDRLYRNPVDEGRVRWMLQRGVIASIRTPRRDYLPADAGLLMAVESGRAVEHILSMARNLKRTHVEKLKHGQWPGPVTTGYMFDHSVKNIVHDPATAKIIRGLFEAFSTGRLGLHSAGLWLAEAGIKSRNGTPFSKSQVQKMLNNRLYMGVMVWKGETHEGKFAPIVSAELFDQVQKALKIKSKPRKVRKGHNFPFCGVFHCTCGAMISAQWAKGHGGLYRYYRCSRKVNRPCSEPYVQERSVTDQCLEKLRPFAVSAEEAKEIHAAIDAEAENSVSTFKSAVTKADEMLTPLENELRELTRLLAKGIVDEETYCQTKEALVLEKTRLKQERQRLQKTHEQSWIEPARKFVNALETLGKTNTTENLPEISGIVQKFGTNHIISRKTVSFSVDDKYVSVPSLLASSRVASPNQSSPSGDKNWWSTKWCAC